MGCGKSRPADGSSPAAGGAPEAAQNPADPECAMYLSHGVVAGSKLMHEDGYVDMREGTLSKPHQGQRVIIFKISGDHPRYQIEALRRDTERAKLLSHPACLQIHRAWEEEGEGFHIVEELPPGKVLLEDLIRSWPTFCEKDVASIAAGVLGGVAYLHAQGVAHRELNIGTVFVERDDGGVRGVKIVDFSLSSLRELEDAGSLRKSEYPPYHLAPEVIVDNVEDHPREAEASFPADVWSVGVLVYTLLSGYPPIRCDDRRELVKKLRAGQVVWGEEVWADGAAAQLAKEFVGGMLVLDKTQRATPAALLQHAWVTDLTGHRVEPLNIGARLEKYKARTRERKLKAIVRGMTAVARLAKNHQGKEGVGNAIFAAMQQSGSQSKLTHSGDAPTVG
mmetsp:Transcript_9882/g.19277  ORF Transcript_9882/g.19277 Transcript_9882/m.19277 type:complete len:393 (-) Transcript_9882:268-1446(-)|eukprot:CAMPEP_0173414360 /NCGR_PEP_ID=MMETSP1356-20130122/84285_1 /TAXON_ID=77927 ORGANISM="Hemiselmis virescens, Strain PCC157" /NCGR_SAMPLE_ID=MMETSP1356 /ASSEMBLY_ACC=CAM_ASM_000847 /LENGTH=392 /DNA_ID=CAMNT_0014376535 /DNA_START=139 /DNA_END=1317 /DNA_ORIENTATION=-